MPLRDFRVEGSPDDPWADIKPLQTTYQGSVLAFDQSIGATGWVNLQVEGAHDDISVTSAGLLSTEVDDRLTITADFYHRGTVLRPQINDVIHRATPDLVVVELPPTGARQMRQATSSFLAGFVIYEEARRFGITVQIVQAQAAKKRWTGNAGAKKPMVREALVARYPWVADMRPLNEHTTDAVLLALTALDGYAAK